MTISEQPTMYAEYLRKEGFEPEILDGEIRFANDGGIYYLDADSADRYFCILLSAFYQPDDSPDDTSKVQATCSAVTLSCKTVKCFLFQDKVWAWIEQVVDKPEDFKIVFDKCVATLRLRLMTFDFLLADPAVLHS